MFPDRIRKLINENSFDQGLRARLEEWGNSPNFGEFVNQNEKKIYKRLNANITDEDKYDIGIELHIAFVFSQANCHVIYEPNVPSIPRGPDFKISFENYCFYFEVKRLRKYNPALEDVCINKKTGDKAYPIDNERMFKKCGDVICEKVGQTVPEEINLIYIRHNAPDAPNTWDLKNAVKSITEWKEMAPQQFERKIKRYKINTIDEFNEFWRQLSAIVISRPKGFISQIWENPEALNPLNQNIKTKIEEATELSFRYDSFNQ